MKASLACVLFVAFTIPAAVSASAQPAADRKADDAAIAKLSGDYQAAYNGHDAKAAAACYAIDGDRRTTDGRVVKGRAAVEQQLADDFKGRFKNATVKFDAAADIRYAGASMAIVDGSAQLSAVAGVNGEPMPAARMFHTLVLVKRNGAWQILALRNWAAGNRSDR